MPASSLGANIRLQISYLYSVVYVFCCYMLYEISLVLIFILKKRDETYIGQIYNLGFQHND